MATVTSNKCSHANAIRNKVFPSKHIYIQDVVHTLAGVFADNNYLIPAKVEIKCCRYVC